MGTIEEYVGPEIKSGEIELFSEMAEKFKNRNCTIKNYYCVINFTPKLYVCCLCTRFEHKTFEIGQRELGDLNLHYLLIYKNHHPKQFNSIQEVVNHIKQRHVLSEWSVRKLCISDHLTLMKKLDHPSEPLTLQALSRAVIHYAISRPAKEEHLQPSRTKTCSQYISEMPACLHNLVQSALSPRVTVFDLLKFDPPSRNGKSDKVQCCLCGIIFKLGTGPNRSDMLNHLYRYHYVRDQLWLCLPYCNLVRNFNPFLSGNGLYVHIKNSCGGMGRHFAFTPACQYSLEYNPVSLVPVVKECVAFIDRETGLERFFPHNHRKIAFGGKSRKNANTLSHLFNGACISSDVSVLSEDSESD